MDKTRPKTVFSGVDTYIDKAYSMKQLPKPKIQNCTNTIGFYQGSVSKSQQPPQLRQLVSQQQSQHTRGRMPRRFSIVIQEQNQTLSRLRRGISIFEYAQFRDLDKSSLPLKVSEKQNLQHYLELSVANQSYCHSMEVAEKLKMVNLIEQSPQKVKLRKGKPFDVMQIEQPSQQYYISTLGDKLQTQSQELQEQFEYPPNPYHSTKKQSLQNLHQVCLKNGLPSSILQKKVSDRFKAKIEHTFWRNGIEQTLARHSQLRLSLENQVPDLNADQVDNVIKEFQIKMHDLDLQNHQLSDSEDEDKQKTVRYYEQRLALCCRKLSYYQQDNSLTFERKQQKIALFTAKITIAATNLIATQEKKQLVAEHHKSIETLHSRLYSLEKLTNEISSGDVRNITEDTYAFDPDQPVIQKVATQPEYRFDETGYPSHTQSHADLLNCCVDQHNKPVFNLIHTSQKIARRNLAFAVETTKMFDRLMMDRGILLNEKFKAILGNQGTTKGNRRQKIKQQQHQNMVYSKIIAFMQQNIAQNCNLNPEEIKLVNVIRVIFQGGWVLNPSILNEVLQMSGVEQIQKEYCKWYDTQQGQFELRKLKVIQTAHVVCTMLGFPSYIFLDKKHIINI